MEKSRDKREKKSVVRISERRVIRVVRIRVEQAVKFRTMQTKEKIRSEKV